MGRGKCSMEGDRGWRCNGGEYEMGRNMGRVIGGQNEKGDEYETV